LDKEGIYGRTLLKGDRKKMEWGNGLDAASLTSECGNWHWV